MCRMRKLLFILCLLFPADLIAQTTYYVSSSGGNDTNSGTSESQPWKTLSKVNNFKPSPGDQILFKRSDSWEGTLTPSTSGTSGSPIVFGAYGSGEKPKIYSSQEINGWTLYSGNIYKATFNSDVYQLFINDKRVRVARTPNSGWDKITSTNGSTTLISTDLNGGIDYAGATILARTVSWKLAQTTVTSSSQQTLTLKASLANGANVGEGIVLLNKLAFLDSPGEWCYDISTNTVYLWTPNGDTPSNYSVRGTTDQYGIYLSGKSNVKIQNLEILHSYDRGLFGNNSSNITVDNCIFRDCDSFAIRFSDGSCSNEKITNCQISGTNGTGILIYASGSTITNNTITRTSMFDEIGINTPYTSSAIESVGGNITLQYNRIDSVGYNGIWFRNGNQLVDKNFITNTCMVLGDGGGIYTWSDNYSNPGSDGSVISNNIVLNSEGNLDGYTNSYTLAYGIYIDQKIHGVTIKNNTVAHTSGGLLINVQNGNLTITGNTFMNMALGIEINPQNAVSTINDNIIYATNVPRSAVWWTNKNQRMVRRYSAYPTMDNNTYISHYNNSTLFDSNSDGYFEPFSNWQAVTGQDSHSIMDITPLNAGEKEQLFYNATKQKNTISLGTSVYRDIKGNQVSGTLALEPFTSKILIKTTLTNTSGSNQSPVIQDQFFDIIQNKAVNDFIGQAVASDPDAGQTLTYSIVQGNDGNLFSIDPATGAITANTTILANVDQSYALIIRVTDDASNPLFAEAQVTITIKNTFVAVDTTNPVITSFEIPATSSSLEVPIANLAANDESGIAGYQLTESAIAPLSTDAEWSSTAPSTYTFAKEGTKTLYAWAKDSAGNVANPQSASVTITLPDLSPTSSEYKFEETSGTTVIDSKGSNNGTIVNSTSRITGAIKQGLEFTGTGYITIGQAFGENVQQEVTLAAWLKPTLKSSDYQGIIMHGGPNVDTYALYIYPNAKRIAFKTSGTSSSWFYIDNVNKLWDGNWHQIVVTYDGAQKIIYLDNTVLATVAATGVIDSGQGYHLMIGAGRDEATPTLLYQGSIDEVSIYNYALTISEVNDLYHLGSESAAATVNQSPLIQDQSFQITEPLAKNDFVGQVLASDPDPGSTLSYTIAQGNETGLFAIDPVSGVVTANSNIPTTTAQSYSLAIQVTDNVTNPLSASAEITVNVVQSNQSPVVTNQSFDITLNKNANEVIGQVAASDPDPGQTLTFSITQGNNAGLFAIDPSTGTITARSAIQTTPDQTYVLTVKVVDNDTNPLSATASIIVKITHTNLSPVIQNQAFDITQNKNENGFIGQVFASDPNAGQSLTFSITQGNNAGLFAIDPSSGTITAKSPIQTTSEQIYVLMVKVADNDVNPLSANAQVTIHVIGNQQNQSPVISDQTFQIRKNDQVGDIIGQVIASDPDAGQTLSYSITSGNDKNWFAINAATGDIVVNNIIDATTSTSFGLVVQVADNAPTPLSSSATITINISITGKISQGIVKNSKKDCIILTATDLLQTTTLKSTALASSFILNDNRKVNNVTINGSKIYLDVDSEYKYGDEIEVSYVKGSSVILDTSGNEIESFSSLPVENLIEEDAVATGIDPETDIIDVAVYPNPSNGIFKIKASNLKSSSCVLSIFDLTGKQIISKQLNTNGAYLEETINLSYIIKGTYIVRLVGDVELYRSKIIII